MKNGLRIAQKKGGLNQYFVEDYTVNFLKMTQPIPKKSEPVPQAWKDAIAYNVKYAKFSSWLVYELGFLSGETAHINAAINEGEIGNEFTYLVYTAQKYLSVYYNNVKPDGKLGDNTKQAMLAWSKDTTTFNKKHIESVSMKDSGWLAQSADFAWAQSSLLDVATPGHSILPYTLKAVNKEKGTSNKEFSWLVLSAQRILFRGNVKKQNGKFDDATRQGLLKRQVVKMKMPAVEKQLPLLPEAERFYVQANPLAVEFNEIAFDYFIKDTWKVYELGFLAGKSHLIKKVLADRRVGSDITWLVHGTQAYLSRYYPLKVNGEFNNDTKTAMMKWSNDTIQFNKKQFFTYDWMYSSGGTQFISDFERIKSILLKITGYSVPDLKRVVNKKDVSSKEFSWLVLEAQRILFHGDVEQHDGRFGDLTRKKVEAYAEQMDLSDDPISEFYRRMEVSGDADATEYNKKKLNYFISDNWLVYELGFLSGKSNFIQEVISTHKVDNYFTMLVYYTQEYLSKYYSLKVNGKLEDETRQAMIKWSNSALEFNRKNISPAEFTSIQSQLFSVALRGEDRYIHPELRKANNEKGTSSKEFAWLVLAAQRTLFPLDPTQQDGKLGPATRNKLKKLPVNDAAVENYTIFVNGLVGWGFGGKPAQPGPIYWRGANKDPEQFIDAAEAYLGDDIYDDYIDGTGDTPVSTALTRQIYGMNIARRVIPEIKRKIAADPNFQISALNFVTHSMGAATAEGMISIFMKDKELKYLLEKGQIVHFSAADADTIVISENSKHLRRTQINYIGDKTLKYADGGLVGTVAGAIVYLEQPNIGKEIIKNAGSRTTGGYQIPGVTRFAVIRPNMKKAHPHHFKTGYDYDWHNETKWYRASWEFIKELDERLEKDPSLKGKPVLIDDIDDENVPDLPKSVK